MDKSVKKLREEYQEYYDLAHSNEIKKKKMADIKESKARATEAVESVQTNGQFEHLEEANFYRQKFEELEKAYNRAKSEKMKWSEFNPIVTDIFDQREYVAGHSYVKPKPKDNELSSAPAIQNRLISSFFEQKKSKLMPDVGFKSILENPPVTSKHFRKKAQSNNEEIDRLRAQNFDLRRKLDSGESSGHDNDKLRRQEERIRELENENDMLSRDNDRLRSQKSVSSGNTALSYEDSLQSPYIMAPRENDLYKINVRNYSDAGTYDRQHFEGDSFNAKNNSRDKFRDTYSNYSEDRSRNYSVFDMSKSYYSDQGDFNSSKVGIDNSRTVGKNKTAFFKRSGVLMREQEYEVAYKRSDPEEGDNYSKVRIILYFNNKSGISRSLDTNYEYESKYYDLDVKETLREIKPFKQGREVIEISLKPGATDINSVIEAVANLDGTKFRLWIPAMFIKITRAANNYSSSAMGQKTIYPHKYFRSASDASRVIDEAERDGDDLKMWGKSKFEEGPIELHWKENGKLVVKAPEKWVDFLSFVMFDFKD